jgi:glycosyltransferase involved in cell wall biosynthesis
LVQYDTTSDRNVYGLSCLPGRVSRTVRGRLDKLPLKRYRNQDREVFSPAWLPERREKQVARHDPDVVNLHWVAGGFLRPETVARFESPVVWTLHDMWPVTGGCHYSKDCDKYVTECKECPHLGSDDPDDLANRVWRRKADAWDDVNLAVVAPSRWLGDVVERSTLLSDATVEVVPNGLDIQTFRPRPSNAVRDELDIPADKKLVCFGVAEATHRKGIDLLYEALGSFETPSESLYVSTFGDTTSEGLDSDLPVHNLGYLDEETLRGLYSDADVMVVPSRQEAFGQTASEALASGTPVVCFDSTGLRDVVDHEETGYRAECYDPVDLAQGIDWVLEDTDRLEGLSERARETAKQRFSLETVAEQYQQIYRQVQS